MTSKLQGSFCLDKTYFDFTDAEGNCFILYSARLKTGFFQIPYAAYIFSGSDGKVTEASALAAGVVRQEGDSIFFTNDKLQVSGQWQGGGMAVSSTLYQNGKGIVHWDCHHPLATATIRFGDQSFTGLGYAETLRLSVKPWQLPIDELRWGRFLANGTSITWIQWKGKYPLNKIYHNGVEYNDALFENDRIFFNNGACCLHFEQPSLLRKVRFAEHAAKIPLLKFLLKKALLHSLEIKYKSPTSFTAANGTVCHGWSIFETVTWQH